MREDGMSDFIIVGDLSNGAFSGKKSGLYSFGIPGSSIFFEMSLHLWTLWFAKGGAFKIFLQVLFCCFKIQGA